MSELLRKIGLFGIGVLALSQEKIEELSTELVDKGELNREEGKKFVKEVLSEKDRQLKELGEKINLKVKEAVENSGVVTKKDIESLKREIDDLRIRIELLEKWKQS